MELHRSRNTRSLALKGIVAGLAGVALGSVGLLTGGPFGAFAMVGGWVGGGFILLVGLVLFGLSFRPFRIAFSDAGLVVDCEGQRFEGPWTQVEAISIERLKTEDERYGLVLWVHDGVPMKHAPTFPPGGSHRGHFIVELSDIKESREVVAAALSRHAGERFRSLVPQS